MEKPFSIPEISDKWKRRFFTSQKQFLLGAMKFSLKIGFLIILIMISTRKKNTINTKEYYFT